MVDQGEKVRVNRLRRWARRLGLEVRKSRVRATHLDDFGWYRLVNTYRNSIEAGERFDLDLDDVERMLEGREEQLEAERKAGQS